MVSLRFKTIQKLAGSDRELWEDICQAYNPSAFNVSFEMGNGLIWHYANNIDRAAAMLNEFGYLDEQIESKIKVAAKLLLKPLPKYLSASLTSSDDDYVLFDLWLGEEVPPNSLIFVKFGEKQYDWARKKLA